MVIQNVWGQTRCIVIYVKMVSFSTLGVFRPQAAQAWCKNFREFRYCFAYYERIKDLAWEIPLFVKPQKFWHNYRKKLYLGVNLACCCFFCVTWAKFMAILHGFAARCLFCVARQGRWLCAVSTSKSLLHQRNALQFTVKAPNPLWRGEFLISSPRHGYCDVFFVGIFLKVFNSGQSDVRSGTSMTTCCVVNTNILNTLIQLNNSKHRSRAISRLSEGRKIHVLSCIIY